MAADIYELASIHVAILNVFDGDGARTEGSSNQVPDEDRARKTPP
jgi:hypothetical protein